MKHTQVVLYIEELSAASALTFPVKGKKIEDAIRSCNKEDLLDHLDYGGVIPECFDHDSTEEKLFAKYCDAVLAHAWSFLGLKTKVIDERADAADVVGEAESYKIVGDAKAFRLSRTAKNQKDFKVVALNGWKKSENAQYACLLSPYYQYPNKNSQIYEQAITHNVTLLSYTDFSYIIRAGIASDLEQLWNAAKGLEPGQSAITYWQAMLNQILKVTGTTMQQWKAAPKVSLRQQGEDQVRFWENEKLRMQKLAHDEAIAALIKAHKIDSKIEIIRKSVAKLESDSD